MEKLQFLPSVVILLAASVFVVAVFRRLNLSPVLGYFVAGAAIGDHGFFKIVSHTQTEVFGEFGIIFLLFAIGLELSFERLKAMRKYVFGFGSLQVIITSILIAGAVELIYNNSNAAIIIGGGLALSSTAIVLQVIAEARSQSTQVSRIALAVLLLQDFAVVPLLVIVPLLSGDKSSIPYALASAFVKAIAALIGIFIIGRVLLRPLFNLITSDNTVKSNELFIAMTILIALAAAWGTEYMGLSLALGAFVAGTLVAETEFQLQAEESIAPFKGLLLGLFFMTVGMTIDVVDIYNELGKILTLSLCLIVVKSAIIIGLCILFGFNRATAVHTGLLLSQGGEFAFILFNLGINNGIIDPNAGKILLLVVTFTMALTPLLSKIGEKLASLLEERKEKSPLHYIEIGTRDVTNHVVIAGFGRVGKMVARVLEAENIHYIIIDINDDYVKEERSNGYPIFKGDISHFETLKAAGLDRALSVILAINNEVTLKKALKVISANFPEVAIVARAQDLNNASDLYELGATMIVPEVYETGLQLGGAVLKSVGISEYEISRIKNQLRSGNYLAAKLYEDENVDG
ncbi:MAG: Glutathione-regulated potassium-efflux system protein [Rickettsiaceae bacterium]|nr:Glutathione-regulated potassium-efflux system protein [Rickettsiaceae bacterium]